MSPFRYYYPILLIVIALVVRILFLGKQSFWLDEGFSIWMASHPFHDIFRSLEVDAHPPLFYSLLHLWMLYGSQESYLRFPFALLGVANCFLIYGLGKTILDDKTAILASLLWATSFAALETEAEVRSYSMAICFCLWASLILLQAVERPSFLKWCAYVCVMSLALYTHYYTGLIFLAHLVFLATQKKFREITWIVLGSLMLYLPWFPQFLNQFINRVGQTSPFPFNAFFTFSAYLGTYYFFSDNLQKWIWSVLGFSGMLIGAFFAFRSKEWRKRYLVFLFGIPFILLVVCKAIFLHFFAFRYAIIFAPYFFLLLAFAIAQLRKPVVIAVTGMLVALNLGYWGLFLTGPGFERQNWRAVASLLRTHVRDGDVVIAEQFVALFPLWTYLPDKFEIQYLPGEYAFAVIPKPGSNVLWIPLLEDDPDKQLQRISQRSKRIWLVTDVILDPRIKAAQWLSEHRKKLLSVTFPSLNKESNIPLLLFDGDKGPVVR